MSELQYFIDQFSKLHVKYLDRHLFPNKAVLLLSIMELMECGYLKSNKIFLEPILEEAFNSNWYKYVGSEPPVVWTPFWHMKTEPFWFFQPLGDEREIEELVPPGQTASVGKMRKAIRYAYITPRLYDYLQMSESRDELYSVLVEKYIRN